MPVIDLTEYAKKSDIPIVPEVDLTEYAKKSDLPMVDLTEYAKKSDLPVIDLTEYAKKSDLPVMPVIDLTEYAKKSDLPVMPVIDLTEYAKKSDIPVVDLTEYAKKSDIPVVPEIQSVDLKNLDVNYVILPTTNSAVHPVIKFNTDMNTGISHAGDGSIGIVSNGQLKQVIGEQIIYYDTIAIKDTSASAPSESTEGHLYKKPNNNGLFWSTSVGEVNLVKETNNEAITLLTQRITDIDQNIINVEQKLDQKIADLIPALNAKAESCVIDAYLDELKSQTQNLNNQLNSLNTELKDDIKLQADELKSQADELKSQNDDLKLQTNELKSQNDDLKLYVDELKLQANELKSQADELKSQNEYLSAELNNTREKVQRIETLTAAVELQAGSNIQIGDVICMTESGAHKTIGYFEELLDNNAYNFIAHDKNTILRQGNQVYLVNQETKLLGTIAANNKIALIESNAKTYIAELSNECVIRIYGESEVKLTIPLNENYVNIVAGVSDITRVGVVVLASDTGDFLVIMIDLETDTLGSIDNHIMIGENSIAHSIIHESEKHMSLCVIPGGTCILAYGRLKIPFLVATADGMITTGEPYVDFQNDDCLGIIYDEHIGYFISLEKSQGGAFVQAMDTIGTNLQKLSNIRLSNVDNPLAIAKNANHYTVVHVSGENQEVLDIKFDGNFTINMRAKISGSSFTGIIHNGQNFLLATDKLHKLYDDYKGRPSDYIGLARSNAAANQDVSVQIRGTMFDSNIDLPLNWVGKKLYLSKPNEAFPNNLSVVNGVPVGTCISRRRILVGL